MASAAQAEDFSAAAIVMQSSLSATVSQASINVSQPVWIEAGNYIHGGFNGTSAVLAVLQNTGANAAVQQNITLNIGNLSLPYSSAAR